MGACGVPRQAPGRKTIVRWEGGDLSGAKHVGRCERLNFACAGGVAADDGVAGREVT